MIASRRRGDRGDRRAKGLLDDWKLHNGRIEIEDEDAAIVKGYEDDVVEILIGRGCRELEMHPVAAPDLAYLVHDPLQRRECPLTALSSR